jgi:hypothetical protein
MSKSNLCESIDMQLFFAQVFACQIQKNCKNFVKNTHSSQGDYMFPLLLSSFQFAQHPKIVFIKKCVTNLAFAVEWHALVLFLAVYLNKEKKSSKCVYDFTYFISPQIQTKVNTCCPKNFAVDFSYASY